MKGNETAAKGDQQEKSNQQEKGSEKAKPTTPAPITTASICSMGPIVAQAGHFACSGDARKTDT